MPSQTIYPFPHELALPVYNILDRAQARSFYNDPLKDGVQYNVRITGSQTSWDFPDAYFESGVGYSAVWGWTGDPRVNGAALHDMGTYFQLDQWAYSGHWLVNSCPAYANPPNAVFTAYVPINTTYTYPGIASTVAPWSAGYVEWQEVGVPCLIEAWFSENPAKTGDTIFNGYTIFGDQGSTPLPQVYDQGNPSEYIRTYVGGILKVDADSTDPADSDIIYGVVFRGTPSGGEGRLVVNGQLFSSATMTARPTDAYGSFDTAFDDDIALLDGLACGAGWFQLVCIAAGATYPYAPGESIELYVDSYDDLVFGLDTKDVKFVSYVDRVTGLAPGTPTGEYLNFSLPFMYTHPGWGVGGSRVWTNFKDQTEY